MLNTPVRIESSSWIIPFGSFNAVAVRAPDGTSISPRWTIIDFASRRLYLFARLPGLSPGQPRLCMYVYTLPGREIERALNDARLERDKDSENKEAGREV